MNFLLSDSGHFTVPGKRGYRKRVRLPDLPGLSEFQNNSFAGKNWRRKFRNRTLQ